MNNAVYVECEKKQSHNRKNKKLFSNRTILSCYKGFHRKAVNNRNKKKTEILMNKPVFLGLSILQSGKTLIYEF